MTPDVNAGRPSYLGDGGDEDEPHGVDEGEDMTPDVNNAGRPSYTLVMVGVRTSLTVWMKERTRQQTRMDTSRSSSMLASSGGG